MQIVSQTYGYHDYFRETRFIGGFRLPNLTVSRVKAYL